MSMMREQILAFRRSGLSTDDICEVMKLSKDVVEMALLAKGGSTVLRKEQRAIEDAAPDEAPEVSADESREMLDIIKNIARREAADNPAVALASAKYVHGVAAGHYRKWDVNVDAYGLLLKINDAYGNANERAFAALRNVTPPAVDVPREPAAPDPGP
jgi:hypothetical protein